MRSNINSDNNPLGVIDTRVFATFKAGQSVSEPVNVGQKRLVGLVFLGDWEGGLVRPLLSIDGMTFHAVSGRSGQDCRSYAEAGKMVLFGDDDLTADFSHFRLASFEGIGSTVAVPQSSARSVTLILAD